MDQWGGDPSVQIMRKVFNGMEKAQHDLLKQLDVAPYDLRIRRWRDQALSLFEKTWHMADRMGATVNEQTAPAVYVHCLAKIMGSEGIHIPVCLLPEAEKVERIFKEVLS